MGVWKNPRSLQFEKANYVGERVREEDKDSYIQG